MRWPWVELWLSGEEGGGLQGLAGVLTGRRRRRRRRKRLVQRWVTTTATLQARSVVQDALDCESNGACVHQVQCDGVEGDGGEHGVQLLRLET